MNPAQWNPCTALLWKGGLRNHLSSQFPLLIDCSPSLDKVCEAAVAGNFLEQNLARRTGGEGIIHRVSATGAGKRRDFLALTAEGLAFVILVSRLEAWQLMRPCSEG